MYQHHIDSIEKMKEYFRMQPNVTGLFLTGSVANGNEREDSDLDGVVIVTAEAYEERKKNNSLDEVIFGYSTYEGGYFDVKYMSKDRLKELARSDKEVYRALFANAKLLFSDDAETEGLIEAIRRYPTEGLYEKFLRYYGSIKLAYDYFWCNCHVEGYMKRHMADHIVYHIYRLILLENRIYMPSARRIEQVVESLENKPEHIVEKCTAFLDTLDDSVVKSIIKEYEQWTAFKLPEDYGCVINNYIDPYEEF